MTHLSIFIRDFNSHHTNWGYKTNDTNSEIICNWMENQNMQLSFNIKDRKAIQIDETFDLCIILKNKDRIAISANRTVLKDIPRSQHRPILINVGIQISIVKII